MKFIGVCTPTFFKISSFVFQRSHACLEQHGGMDINTERASLQGRHSLKVNWNKPLFLLLKTAKPIFINI